MHANGMKKIVFLARTEIGANLITDQCLCTFLHTNEAPGLEQAAVVTMATRVLRPLKRAFLCIPSERLTACKI